MVKQEEFYKVQLCAYFRMHVGRASSKQCAQVMMRSLRAVAFLSSSERPSNATFLLQARSLALRDWPTSNASGSCIPHGSVKESNQRGSKNATYERTLMEACMRKIRHGGDPRCKHGFTFLRFHEITCYEMRKVPLPFAPTKEKYP